MNIERLKDWNITNPKSGIQRSVFGIGLQQSKSYLRLLQCVTPLVKLVPAYVSSCASRGETESRVSSSHSLISVAWLFLRNGTLSAGSTAGGEGNSQQQGQCFPKPQTSVLSSAQLCSALLCSALPLASWHCHGLLPSGIWHSSTPLCLLGAEHTNHTPALHLILWHWAGSEQPGKEQIWPQLSWYSLLGLLWDLNSYTALILKKTQQIWLGFVEEG